MFSEIKPYIDTIPSDRKEIFLKIRHQIKKNLPPGFKEILSYKMIGYVVPHSLYPKGYHCNPKLPLPFAHLANQKNHITIYHSGIYADRHLLKWFVNQYAWCTKEQLNMGKSCIRFKPKGDIPLLLLGELMRKITLDQWIHMYEKKIKGK